VQTDGNPKIIRLSKCTTKDFIDAGISPCPYLDRNTGNPIFSNGYVIATMNPQLHHVKDPSGNSLANATILLQSVHDSKWSYFPENSTKIYEYKTELPAMPCPNSPQQFEEYVTNGRHQRITEIDNSLPDRASMTVQTTNTSNSPKELILTMSVFQNRIDL